MDSLPPTVDQEPAQFYETKLSDDLIGWHKCWRFVDHVAPWQERVKGKKYEPFYTVNWKHYEMSDYNEQIYIDASNSSNRNLQRFDDRNTGMDILPPVDYGGILYLSDAPALPAEDGMGPAYQRARLAQKRAFMRGSEADYKKNKIVYSYGFVFNEENKIKYIMKEDSFKNISNTFIDRFRDAVNFDLKGVEQIFDNFDNIISYHKEQFDSHEYLKKIIPLNEYPRYLPENKIRYAPHVPNYYIENQDKKAISVINSYKGVVLFDVADGAYYWMISDKHLYIYREHSVSGRRYFSKEEYSSIVKLVGYENAETYFQSYGYYPFPEEDWGVIWMQRWKPIPEKECHTAFKPVADDPALPTYLKPILPSAPKPK